MSTTTHAAPEVSKKPKSKLPSEVNILLILVGIAVLFEIMGWIIKGDSFLFNPQRL